MNFWKKLKQANDAWKKFIIFCSLAILAALLFLLVGQNFTKKLNTFDKQKFYQILKLDKLQQAKDSAFSEMGQQEKSLTSSLQAFQEMAQQPATSTSATTSENTTTTNY
ncbi:MAG: hypothetical protein PHW31_04180 [Candidatus Pacebacteria bacterium]|nr:hypothetical protein [Candidatus Paceibacterota bacterium]